MPPPALTRTEAEPVWFKPFRKTYQHARDTQKKVDSFFCGIKECADSIDLFVKSSWDSKKTGEAHLAPEVAEKEIADLVGKFKLPSGFKPEVAIPANGPFIAVTLKGAMESRNVTLSILLCANRTPGTNEFVISVAYVEFKVLPAIEDPDKLDEHKSIIALKEKENATYAKLVQDMKIRESDGTSIPLHTIEVPLPADSPFPMPVSIGFISGLSVFLYREGTKVIKRSPRGNQHHWVVEVGVDWIKDEIKKAAKHTKGNVNDDENNFEFAEARNIRIAALSRMDFDEHFHFHRWIGGKKGCNFFYCYDYRMWIGAKGSVPMHVDFSTSISSNREQVKLRAVPSHEDYGVNLYYKNLKLILKLGEWVFKLETLIENFVKALVNSKLNQMTTVESEMPLPDLSSANKVKRALVVLDAANGEESIRYNVDFDF